MLILWVLNDYYVEIADVQTAFLHGQLEETLYIDIPQGYNHFMKLFYPNHNIGNYLKLNKSIYGLVQAVQSWWKKFSSRIELHSL